MPLFSGHGPEPEPRSARVSDSTLREQYAAFTLQDRKGNLWVYRGPPEPAEQPTITMQFYNKTLPGFFFPAPPLEDNRRWAPSPPTCARATATALTPATRPLERAGQDACRSARAQGPPEVPQLRRLRHHRLVAAGVSASAARRRGRPVMEGLPGRPPHGPRARRPRGDARRHGPRGQAGQCRARPRSQSSQAARPCPVRAESSKTRAWGATARRLRRNAVRSQPAASARSVLVTTTP